MPFGVVFAAVVFAALCFWPGALVVPSLPRGLSAVLTLVLGASLAVGLLLRQGWARWGGAGAAALIAGIGARQIATTGGVLDHVVLLVAVATFALLLAPATGDPRRGTPAPPPPRALARALMGAAAASGLLLGGGLVLGLPSGEPRALQRNTETPALPAPAPGSRPAVAPRAGSIAWRSFAEGRARAQAERKALFVEFYATWCGVCQAMERKTYRHPEVVGRLAADVVSVRVDAEDEARKNGVSGVELAERYRIRGYPTFILMDPEGREISRRSGFLEPSALVSWLERALGTAAPSRAGVRTAGS